MARKENLSSSTMIRWFFLVSSLMAQAAYAFQCNSALRDRLALIASFQHSRFSHAFNGIASIGDRRMFPPSRTRSVFTTRLQYGSDMDGSSSSTSPIVSSSGGSSWWKTLFATDGQGTTLSDRSVGDIDKQQQSVDAYLEFLDRRYKRLHSSECIAEDSKSKNPVTFSAMNWLLNGKGDTILTNQQTEDSLYVLGVASLASQKLLQKHQLHTTGIDQTTPTFLSRDAPSRAHSQQSSDFNVIEVTAEVDSPASPFVRMVLVPFIRALYAVQRYKQLFFRKLQDEVKQLGSIAIQNVIRPVRKLMNPKSVLNGLLELGGGKQNVMVVMTVTYAAVLLLQPMMRAALAETSVHP